MPNQAADEQWLRELYDAQWVALVRLAMLLLGSSDRAEEVVQDAFIAIHQRRDQFDQPRDAVGYLRTSVVNRCRSAHRHRAVVNRYRPDPTPGPATPEQLVTSQDDSERLLAALDQLSGRQREVVIMRYYSDASEAEIAESLGISRGAVKSHAHRAIAALRGIVDHPAGRKGN